MPNPAHPELEKLFEPSSSSVELFGDDFDEQRLAEEESSLWKLGIVIGVTGCLFLLIGWNFLGSPPPSSAAESHVPLSVRHGAVTESIERDELDSRVAPASSPSEDDRGIGLPLSGKQSQNFLAAYKPVLAVGLCVISLLVILWRIARGLLLILILVCFLFASGFQPETIEEHSTDAKTWIEWLVEQTQAMQSEAYR